MHACMCLRTGDCFTGRGREGSGGGGVGRRKTLCYALNTDFEMSSFLEMNALGVRVKLLNGSIPVDN